VVIIRDKLSIRQIGDCLAEVVHLKTRPLCVYGSDRIPENAVRSSLLSDCLACNMYHIAEGRAKGPVYVGNEPGQVFCRCMGGPAWFGYAGFDPRLPGLMSTGTTATNQSGKNLKENENIACETYRAVGEIKPLGRYVVMRRCDDMREDPGVKCIICFAGGEQVRDLCALAHFSSHEVFNLVSVPWGPACATLVTYPAGMAEKVGPARIHLGPTDPSARDWLPKDCLAMGIPVEIARKMAEGATGSFLGR
jgi:uncharacterized protein (DUF169 family)